MISRFKPNAVHLSPEAPRRQPVRPVDKRTDDFSEKFDEDVLFYDCFIDANGRSARLLGPPTLNLAPALEASYWNDSTAGDVAFTRFKNMDRHSQVIIPIVSHFSTVRIDGSLGRYAVALEAADFRQFADKRVIFTLSKNNELRWIQDWMRFYRDVHGADAVLIYDNGSTKYSLDELTEAVSDIGGFDAGCIVDWPFKYGPQGFGENDYWDSDFCQRGVLEHARWHFLSHAKSALNCDIDELVIGPDGESLFAVTERSLTGHACFRGVWVYGIDGAPEVADEVLHSFDTYLYYLNPKRADEVWHRRGFGSWKWAIVPRRCPAHFQWNTHNIIGARGLYSKLSLKHKFVYRHFREISDSWFYDRTKRVNYKEGLFLRDIALTRDFAKVDWQG